MNIWIGLLIYLLFMATYWFFVYSIIWHVREYILPLDRSQLFVSAFLAVAGVLSIISFGLFFTLPL